VKSPERDTQRLFFALCPDADVRRRLAAAARQWCRHPVAEHNLHMTLVFVGECSPAQRRCYALAAAGVEAERFTLALNFLGGRARSRIQWLGSSEIPPALPGLVRDLSHALQGCGFETEKRRFFPHVTLSRKAKKPLVKAELDRLVWAVDDFALVESVPEAGGVRYEVLERWPLLPPGR
jgi:2'-5' RNA ligase